MNKKLCSKLEIVIDGYNTCVNFIPKEQIFLNVF